MSTALVELSDNQINEIRQYWAGIDAEIRDIKANAIAHLLRKYECGINELARALDCTPKLIRKYIDFYGVSQAGAKCEGGTTVPSSDIALNKAEKVVMNHAPDDDDKELNIAIDEYELQGYEPAVAKRLARAELAAEKAIKVGDIEETITSKGEKIRKLIEPENDVLTLMHQFFDHMLKVGKAVKFLDEVNMSFLKRCDVFKDVMEVDKRWNEQVERLRNLHESLEREI